MVASNVIPPAHVSDSRQPQLLSVNNVSRRYGAVQALESVSFSMGSGSILGLLGENGAGKSTLLRILCGYLIPSEGQVLIRGRDLQQQREQALSCVGYMPERAPCPADDTVDEYLSFIASLRSIHRRVRLEHIRKTRKRCGLSGVGNRLIRNLSRGYRQRVALGAALLGEPDLIVLDEPQAGLDPKQIAQMRDLVVELGREKAVILSTHLIQEVEAVCDRVLVLHEGSLVFDGRPDGRAESSVHIYEAVVVVPEDSVRLEELLGEFRGSARVVLRDGSKYTVEVEFPEDESETAFFDWSVANGLKIVTVRPKLPTLQEHFQRDSQGGRS